MKKFVGLNKRNGKSYIVEYMENGEIIVVDMVSGIEKKITESTIKRWYDLSEEIVVPKVEVIEVLGVIEESPILVIKEISNQVIEKAERTDKFRPKLMPEQVLEIREKFKVGSKKSHLAKEYNVSFRTITCIVEYLMWKKVG